MYQVVALAVALVIYIIFLMFRIIFYCQKRITKNTSVVEHPEPSIPCIIVRPTSPSDQMVHGMIFPGGVHTEPQLSPPPYTAVALPPSYEEAIKQNPQGNNASSSASSSTEENKY